MTEKRKNPGRRDLDQCICQDPYRFNDKKIDGDIKANKKEIDAMWKIIDSKITVKVFGIVLTLLIVILIAVGSAMNVTTQRTLSLVLEIKDDVQEIKSQQKIINKILPSPIGYISDRVPGISK